MNLEKSDFIPRKVDPTIDSDELAEVIFGLYEIAHRFGTFLWERPEKLFCLSIDGLPMHKISIQYNPTSLKPSKLLFDRVMLGSCTRFSVYSTACEVQVFLPEFIVNGHLLQLRNAINEILSIAENNKNNPELVSDLLFLQLKLEFQRIESEFCQTKSKLSHAF